MTTVKRIRARAVRGLRDLDLTIDGRSLLLFGENGSGKSSLVDALEFLFRGSIRHLEGTQGISLPRHGPHIELGREAMDVVLTFDPGEVDVSRRLDQNPSVPNELADFWEETERTNFLRRSQLLEFIHADPAERFRVLGSLMGMEQLDDIELVLMRTRDRFEAERDTKEQELMRTSRGLGGIVGQDQAQPDDVLATLNTRAVALGLEPIATTEAIVTTLSRWRQTTKNEDQEQLALLAAIVTEVEAIDHQGLRDQLDDQRNAFEAWTARRADVDRLAEDQFLEQGDAILQGREWDACPLCEQPFDSRETLARVRRRRQELQELSEEFSVFRRQTHALAERLRSLAGRTDNLRNKLPAVEENAAARTDLSKVGALLQHEADEVDKATRFEDHCDVDALRSSINLLERIAKEKGVEARRRTEELSASERDKDIFRLAIDLDLLRAQAEEFHSQSNALEEASEIRRRASHLFEAFSASKKDAVRRIYQVIEADVNSFYSRLHPGEVHGDFRLTIVEGRRASTMLSMRAFGGDETDPRALASEGHLDSLGLCIFLAFVKNFGTASRFMVLDDVIMSIDSSHRGRVAELLLTVFRDWQLLLTTHDEIWFQEFADHQRAYNSTNRFHNLRIERWTLGEGPVIQPYQPRWQRILDKLERADKRGAGNEGRQYLEWILHGICVSVAAPVPLKESGRYTVGDLFDPARSRLLRLLPDRRDVIDALFQEITAAGTPGNLLSHENYDAQAIGVDEIRRFCDSTWALHDWFACRGCMRLPRYVRDANLIVCPNEHCGERKQWQTA